MIQKILVLTIFSFFLVGTIIGQPNKIVLIEEATGTWCAWCPEGKVVGKQLLSDYPEQVIFIEVHGNDPMEYEEYVDSCGFWAYPSGHVNRKMYNLHLQPVQWEGALNQRLNETPPANVYVETVFDTSNRNLTVNIAAEFFDTLSGDYRLAAIVIEDAVTGEDERYGQSNVFANNAYGPMGGFEILPSDIPPNMMAYDYVARHLLGGYRGELGSLPTEIIGGNTYIYSYNWTLSNEYDKDYVWIAALLIDNQNGEVINGGRSIYISGNENAKPFFVTKPITEGRKDYEYIYNVRYHDVNDLTAQIEVLNSLPEWLSFEKGRTGFAKLKGIPTDTGVYDITLRLTDTEYIIDQTFQIMVKDSIPPPTSRVTKDFLILPNPNDGFFDLEFDRGTHYQVFDSSGRKVKEGRLQRNIYDKFFIQSMDFSKLNTGLYFLKVFDSSGYLNTKKLFLTKE